MSFQLHNKNNYRSNFRSLSPNEPSSQLQVQGSHNENIAHHNENIAPKFLQMSQKASSEPHYDKNRVHYCENIGNNIHKSKTHPNNLSPIAPFLSQLDIIKQEKQQQQQQQPDQEINTINNPNNNPEPEEEKDEIEAESWDGPELYESGFYKNNMSTLKIKEIIILKLEELILKEIIDYNINEQNKFEIDGRIFDDCNGEMSEFKITIWKHSNFNCNYKSIVHIKKQSGDGFLFCDLQDQIIHFLQSYQSSLLQDELQQQPQQQSQQEEEEIIIDPFNFNFNFNLELDGGGEGSDMQSPLSDSNNSNGFNKLDYNFDLINDEIEHSNNNEKQQAEQPQLQSFNHDHKSYIINIIDEICDVNNYMENIQTSTCLLLKLNDQEIDMMIAIYTCYGIIDKLLNCIQNQFDVQQIRNVLKVCERLLKNHNIKQNLKQYQNIKNIIQTIQQKWENGAIRSIGNRTIKFGQSQQIVQSCFNCLQTLEQM